MNESQKAIARIIKSANESNEKDKPFCCKESYKDVKEYIKIITEGLVTHYEKENKPTEDTFKEIDKGNWMILQNKGNKFNKQAFLKEAGGE